MFRKSNRFVSGAVGLIIAVSVIVLSGTINAQACPPSPESLYSLYIGSELVVLAEVRNQRDGTITDQRDDSFNIDVERDLDIIETFKGPRLKNILFARNEYRSKPDPESPDGISRIIYFGSYGRNNVYQLTVGGRYVFFMNKDPETGAYALSSYQGIRSIGTGTEDLYKDRFAELSSILDSKENRPARFAEWLVTLIEDPETRWDGAYVLNRSFYSVEYYRDNPEFEEELPEDGEQGIYSTAVARSIDKSQQGRLSTVLYESIRDAFENDEYELADYNLVNIVGHWDRARLATYAFSLLQNVNRDDTGRMARFLRLVANVSGDDDLNEIAWEYLNAVDQNESEDELAGPSPVEEEKPIDSADYLIDESAAEELDEPETSEFEYENVADEPDVAAPENLTRLQLQQKVFGDFINRYNQLVAVNFQTIPEDQ